jgi:uncharacterized membrane protein YeiH
VSFVQFLFYQGLTFLLYFFAIYLTAGGHGLVANMVMNFLTFFSISWLIAIPKSNFKTALPDVLAVTLSFNTVTYLLAYALYSPLPSWQLLLFDYLMVIVYSIIGILAAMRLKQQQSER